MEYIIIYVGLQFLILFFVDLHRNRRPELSKREADFIDYDGAKLILHSAYAEPQNYVDTSETELLNITPFLDESFEIEYAEMHSPEMKSLEYPKSLINKIIKK